MMDLGYVEMVEDMTPAFASTAEVRAALDGVLAAVPLQSQTARPVDRDAWLRGDTDGQSSMLALAAGARRGAR